MAASGSLSGPYRVDVEFDPPAKQSRLTVLFRGFMLIPHIIIMAVLGFVASVAIVLSWLAIIFTGKMPAGLAGFITGVLHWNTRVTATASIDKEVMAGTVQQVMERIPNALRMLEDS